MSDYHRHDLTDAEWEKLEPQLPGGMGKVGRPAEDNRRFINAVKWIFRTGAPWRDLPPDYGHWKVVHCRFCRWRNRGVWEELLEALSGEPDMEWLMIDASHIKVHPHAAGARGGNQEMGKTKGGLNSKLHLAVDAHGMPVRILLTKGTAADCKHALALIEGLRACAFMADRAYDTDEIIAWLQERDIEVVIPPKKNRKRQRSYDEYLYTLRHLVENAFLHLKQWRGIATRYAKNASSFLAAAQFRAAMQWLRII